MNDGGRFPIAHEVLHPAHEVLHPAHEVLHPAHEVLHPAHEVLHPAHEVLHPAHEVLHPAHAEVLLSLTVAFQRPMHTTPLYTACNRATGKVSKYFNYNNNLSQNTSEHIKRSMPLPTANLEVL